MDVPIKCTLCPRACGVDRAKKVGLCGGGARVKVARAALHHWEEPCISGTRGSGTVFFSGCSLQCCYCQNYQISAENFGKEVDVETLARIFLRLQNEGAHNINLVTAAHYLPWILRALTLAKPALRVPIVYNTGGYETGETLRALRGNVDIFLTDIKYFSSALSAEYSNAADYFDVAFAAAKQMIAQTGAPRFDEFGVLQSGTIVRLLVLPGAMRDMFAILDKMAAELPLHGFLLSMMSQYTPFFKACEHPPLGRRISTYEYRKVVDYAIALGLCEGYMQEKSSAKEEYTPLFDLEGVF